MTVPYCHTLVKGSADMWLRFPRFCHAYLSSTTLSEIVTINYFMNIS